MGPRTCVTCGAATPIGARYCAACGAAAGVPAEAQTRPLTILFADMSGSVAATYDLDAEDTAELLNQVAEVMAQAVSAHGGSVDSFLGDGVLALFGTPHAHEDDPERAVLAALAIREGLLRLGRHATAGINTGEAYIGLAGSESHQERAVRGRVINLAARMQAQARPGQIIVGDATYRLARGAFEFAPLSLAVKGVSAPVRAWEVLRPVSRPTKARGIDGVWAELCGREQEVALLKRCAEDASAGHGRAVGLIGDAGVGKSRLLAELKAAKATKPGASWQWLEGRCVESGAATSYLPYVDLLRDHLSWGSRDDEGRQREAITASLDELVDAGHIAPERHHELCAVIGNLLSITAGNGWSHAVDQAEPGELKTLTFLAVRDLVAAVARRAPLVLVLEDLHWADALSIDLTCFLLEHLDSAPLLLLLVSRPEPDQNWRRLSTLASRSIGGHYTELQLHELAAEDSGGLLDMLLGARTLPRETREAILDRAQGNPFFLEEMLRSLIDSGLLYRDGATWRAKAELTSLSVPDSVQSTILSRFDRLDDDLKQVVQIAAVVGRLFERSLLAEVVAGGHDLDRELWELERRELVHQERVLPEVEYSFKHVLTQETIYHSIPRHRRGPLHREVAEAIERVHADNPSAHAEALAFHFDNGDAHDKAVHYLQMAGEKSRRAYLNDDAIHYFDRALDRLDRGPHALAAPLHESLGDVLELTGRHDEALAAYASALSAMPVDHVIGRSTLHRKVGLARQTQRRFDEAVTAFDAADAALGTAPVEADARWWQAWLENQDARAMLHYWRNQVADMQAILERAKPVIDHYATTRQRATFFSSMCIMMTQRDAYAPSDEALHYVRAALAASEEVGDLGMISRHAFGVGFTELWRRELDEAQEHLETARRLAEKTGDLTRQTRCASYLTVAVRLRRQVDETHDHALRSLEVAKRGEMSEYVAMARANLAWVAWRRGEPAEAERSAHSALDMWSGLRVFNPPGYPFDWMARWVLVGLAHGRDDHAEAIRHAKALLGPGRQLPPPELRSVLERMISADRSPSNGSSSDLDRAVSLAADLGYL